MPQEAGAPVKHTQERLGHASAMTTLDIYTHSVSDDGRKYAAAVEAAFPFAYETSKGELQLSIRPPNVDTREYMVGRHRERPF